jgi:hypothetical protein
MSNNFSVYSTKTIWFLVFTMMGHSCVTISIKGWSHDHNTEYLQTLHDITKQVGEAFWRFCHGRARLASLIVIHDITKQVG